MDELVTLDDLIVRLVRRQRSPAYRREVLAGLPDSVGIGGLRVLRSIERLLTRGAAPTIKDIAADLAIEQSTASRAVHDVVAAGLAAKSTCDDDQRKTRMDLTTAGRNVLAQATRNRQALLLRVTADWRRQDLVRLIELLGGLSDDYDATLASGAG